VNATAAPARGSGRLLVAASIALAAVLLDAMAVPVLVPSVRLDLGSSSSGAQWVQNAYLLALAAPLPLLACLTPYAGSRRIALVGALAMATGAVVCASAESTSVLVTGRAVEGAGASALLASLAGTLRSGRGASLTAAAGLPALALAFGPLVGGAFAELDWWRVYFWAGVPLAAVAAAPALLAPSSDRRPPPADLAGLAVFAVGLIGLTIVLVQSEPWGWGWVGLVAALAAGAALRLASPWRGGLPPAASVWFALAGCVAALGFLLPEYFELARGLSSLRTGVLVLALTIPAVTSWAIAGWLAARLGSRRFILAGLACAALALLGLRAIDADTRYALVLLGLGLVGIGLGMSAGAVRRAATAESPERVLGAALTGAAVGLAAAGAVFQHGQADERTAGASFEQALARGVGLATLLLIALLLPAAVAGWRLGRTR
jgi:MFS family permease